jgi:mRNA interferase RelE/StbE
MVASPVREARVPQGRREGKVDMIVLSLWRPRRCIALCYIRFVKVAIYSRDALKTLRGLPPNVADRIRGKIDQYVANPASQANNVKALQGEKGYLRLRVGDWRIIFREDGSVALIVRVAARGSAFD